jgi:hypothetical protein
MGNFPTQWVADSLDATVGGEIIADGNERAITARFFNADHAVSHIKMFDACRR